MKINYVLTVVLSLLFGLNTSAQKIQETVLHYEYIQQPLNPLADLESYSFTVVTPYPENHDAIFTQAEEEFQERLAGYPAEVEAAENAHAERLLNYDDLVALAQENFRLENEAFDNLNAIEKLALEEGRPKLRMPTKPGLFRAPSEPTYITPSTSSSIIFKPQVLADN
jgi:hypothetical protein